MPSIKAPLTGFKPGSYTFTTTAISGGTQYELKAAMNDALKQVVVIDQIVQVVGSQVTISSKVTLNAAGIPIKTLAVWAGQVVGTLLGNDAQGRMQVKSQASGKTYHVSPKTIPGITPTTSQVDAMNAMFKAKGLM